MTWHVAAQRSRLARLHAAHTVKRRVVSAWSRWASSRTAARKAVAHHKARTVARGWHVWQERARTAVAMRRARRAHAQSLAVRTIRSWRKALALRSAEYAFAYRSKYGSVQ